jgi:hypothetical protein
MSIRQEFEGEPHGMRGTIRLVGKLVLWMFRKLWRNRTKRHWLECPSGFLEDRLAAEYEEFLENPTWEEAADLANIAAMLADWTDDRKHVKEGTWGDRS